MALNKSKETVIAQRRVLVAKYRRQGLTLRAMSEALEKEGCLNESGKPWNHATLGNDVKALIAEASAFAVKDVIEHRAEFLDQYNTLNRQAWESKDNDLIIKTLAEMRKMLGADAPQVIIIEQLHNQVRMAIERVEAEFKDEPKILSRVIKALNDE